MEYQQIGAYEAKISPQEQERIMTRKEAFQTLKEMQNLYRGIPGDFNIREAIKDGRKY